MGDAEIENAASHNVLLNESVQQSSLDNPYASLLYDIHLESSVIHGFAMGGSFWLCLSQMSNTVLKNYGTIMVDIACSFLHIAPLTCNIQQLECLKALDAIEADATVCHLISLADAQRLCDFMLESGPVTLLKPFAAFVRVYHECYGGCDGIYFPELDVEYRSRCIQCSVCEYLLSPPNFVYHSHCPKSGPLDSYVNPLMFGDYIRVQSSDVQKYRLIRCRDKKYRMKSNTPKCVALDRGAVSDDSLPNTMFNNLFISDSNASTDFNRIPTVLSDPFTTSAASMVPSYDTNLIDSNLSLDIDDSDTHKVLAKSVISLENNFLGSAGAPSDLSVKNIEIVKSLNILYDFKQFKPTLSALGPPPQDDIPITTNVLPTFSRALEALSSNHPGTMPNMPEISSNRSASAYMPRILTRMSCSHTTSPRKHAISNEVHASKVTSAVEEDMTDNSTLGTTVVTTATCSNISGTIYNNTPNVIPNDTFTSDTNTHEELNRILSNLFDAYTTIAPTSTVEVSDVTDGTHPNLSFVIDDPDSQDIFSNCLSPPSAVSISSLTNIDIVRNLNIMSDFTPTPSFVGKESLDKVGGTNAVSSTSCTSSLSAWDAISKPSSEMSSHLSSASHMPRILTRISCSNTALSEKNVTAGDVKFSKPTSAIEEALMASKAKYTRAITPGIYSILQKERVKLLSKPNMSLNQLLATSLPKSSSILKPRVTASDRNSGVAFTNSFSVSSEKPTTSLNSVMKEARFSTDSTESSSLLPKKYSFGGETKTVATSCTPSSSVPLTGPHQVSLLASAASKPGAKQIALKPNSSLVLPAPERTVPSTVPMLHTTFPSMLSSLPTQPTLSSSRSYSTPVLRSLVLNHKPAVSRFPHILPKVKESVSTKSLSDMLSINEDSQSKQALSVAYSETSTISSAESYKDMALKEYLRRAESVNKKTAKWQNKLDSSE